MSYRYELPNGTISEPFDTIYVAYIQGAQATWGTEMSVRKVKVLDSKDQHVPSYEYCDDCNFAQHYCRGCGDYTTHEQGNDCGEGCTE